MYEKKKGASSKGEVEVQHRVWAPLSTIVESFILIQKYSFNLSIFNLISMSK